MLILTRKKHETINIGDDTQIKILEVTKGHVKIGIHAPKETPVHRSEVYRRIKQGRKPVESR